MFACCHKYMFSLFNVEKFVLSFGIYKNPAVGILLS